MPTLVPDLTPPLPGWDTELARPFEFVEDLPSHLAREHNERCFTVRSGNSTFKLWVRCQENPWLHFKEEEAGETREYYFEVRPNARVQPISHALSELAAYILYLEETEQLTLDLLDFKVAFRSVRSTSSLTDGSQQPLSAIQIQALEYILRCIGLRDYVMLHSGAAFFASDAARTVNLGSQLPEPFLGAPSIQVLLNDGKLIEFREGEIWDGFVSPRFNLIERMSALRRLEQNGLPREAVDRLDRYVEELMALQDLH